MKSLLCCRYYSKYKEFFKTRKVLPSMGIHLVADIGIYPEKHVYVSEYTKGEVSQICVSQALSMCPPLGHCFFATKSGHHFVSCGFLLKYLCRPKQQDLCSCQVQVIVQVNIWTEKDIPGGSF